MTCINIAHITAINLEKNANHWFSGWIWCQLINTLLLVLMGFLNFYLMTPVPVNSGYLIDEFNNEARKINKFLDKLKNANDQ